MDFLNAPGSSLVGGDKLIFDEIRTAIDAATNDFLIRSDWDLNLHCIELIMPLNSSDILSEVTLVLRKKLRSTSPRTLVLTLRLMEALVNNGSNYWHSAMNDERVMKDMAMVARTYCKRMTSPENREVAECCLEIVQKWGELFSSRKRQFPKIVDLYLELRQEGLPFPIPQQQQPQPQQQTQQQNVLDRMSMPPQQPSLSLSSFSASSMDHHPSPSHGGMSVGSNGSRDHTRDHTDGILASAMQSQLDLDRERGGVMPGIGERERERERERPLSLSRLPPSGASPAVLTSSNGNGSSTSRPSSTRLLPPTTPISTPLRYPSPQARVAAGMTSPSPSSSGGSGGGASFTSPYEVLQSLQSMTTILADIVTNAAEMNELRRNDVAEDIANQLQKIQRAVTIAIERAMDNPELLEKLFAVNDVSQTVLKTYTLVKNGGCSLEEAQTTVKNTVSNMPTAPSPPPPPPPLPAAFASPNVGVASRPLSMSGIPASPYSQASQPQVRGSRTPSPVVVNMNLAQRPLPPPGAGGGPGVPQLLSINSGTNSRASSRAASPHVPHYYTNNPSSPQGPGQGHHGFNDVSDLSSSSMPMPMGVASSNSYHSSHSGGQQYVTSQNSQYSQRSASPQVLHYVSHGNNSNNGSRSASPSILQPVRLPPPSSPSAITTSSSTSPPPPLSVSPSTTGIGIGSMGSSSYGSQDGHASRHLYQHQYQPQGPPPGQGQGQGSPQKPSMLPPPPPPPPVVSQAHPSAANTGPYGGNNYAYPIYGAPQSMSSSGHGHSNTSGTIVVPQVRHVTNSPHVPYLQAPGQGQGQVPMQVQMQMQQTQQIQGQMVMMIPPPGGQGQRPVSMNHHQGQVPVHGQVPMQGQGQESSHQGDDHKSYKKMIAKSDSLSNEQIIVQADDPFSAEALDALFDDIPTTKKDKHSERRERDHVLSSGGSVSSNQSGGSNGGTPSTSPLQQSTGLRPQSQAAPSIVYPPPRHPGQQQHSQGQAQTQYMYASPPYAHQQQYTYPQHYQGQQPPQQQQQVYSIPSPQRQQQPHSFTFATVGGGNGQGPVQGQGQGQQQYGQPVMMYAHQQQQPSSGGHPQQQGYHQHQGQGGLNSSSSHHT